VDAAIENARRRIRPGIGEPGDVDAVMKNNSHTVTGPLQPISTLELTLGSGIHTHAIFPSSFPSPQPGSRHASASQAPDTLVPARL
jgi:hypothetical protein